MSSEQDLKFLGKQILLGISGSIAAYKAAELLRALVRQGADVSVVMTGSATQFVSPLTFEVLSGHPVVKDLFANRHEMVHLTMPERADVFVVAPATANVLAKCALGLADDLLSTMMLTATCPIILAPAMDGGMWHHAAVQSHTAALRSRGVTVLDPDEGPLASGKVAQGRLPQEQEILAAIEERLTPRRDWVAQRVLISAGPTQEPIDPVRFISNRSSGKMGYALAQAARERGAQVILVSGPVELQAPPGVEVIPVCSAEDMHKALVSRLRWSTVVVMAAAVSDYRPKRSLDQKLKKRGQPSPTLELEPTTDILATLAQLRATQVLVGFAAETGSPLAQAQHKLTEKGVDLIVGNDVTAQQGGFGSDLNAVVLVDREGHVTHLDLMPKRVLADRILDVIQALKVFGDRPVPRRPGSGKS